MDATGEEVPHHHARRGDESGGGRVKREANKQGEHGEKGNQTGRGTTHPHTHNRARGHTRRGRPSTTGRKKQKVGKRDDEQARAPHVPPGTVRTRWRKSPPPPVQDSAVDQQASQHTHPWIHPDPGGQQPRERSKEKTPDQPTARIESCQQRVPGAAHKRGGRRAPPSARAGRPRHPHCPCRPRRSGNQHHQTHSSSSNKVFTQGKSTRAASTNSTQAPTQVTSGKKQAQSRSAAPTNGTRGPTPASPQKTYQCRPRNSSSKLRLGGHHNDTHDGRREQQQEGGEEGGEGGVGGNSGKGGDGGLASKATASATM